MDGEINHDANQEEKPKTESGNSCSFPDINNNSDQISNSEKGKNELNQPQNKIAKYKVFTEKWWDDHHKAIGALANIFMVFGTLAAVFIASLSLHSSRVAIGYADNSFNAQKQQFEIEHQPFLQIVNIKSHQNDSIHRIETTYDIINLGKQPAKIVSSTYFWWHQPIKDTLWIPIDPGNIKLTTSAVNQYIIEGEPRFEPFNSYDMSKSTYDSIKSKLGWYFICGKIVYVNLANNKKMCYEFNIRITQVDIWHFEVEKDKITKNKFDFNLKEFKDSSTIVYSYNENYLIN